MGDEINIMLILESLLHKSHHIKNITLKRYLLLH